jgi:hypothetical protein
MASAGSAEIADSNHKFPHHTNTPCHYLYLQYLPEVWKRARRAAQRRKAYVKSRFSPRSQKIGFLTEGVEIFFGSSHNGWLLPEFFSDFYI